MSAALLPSANLTGGGASMRIEAAVYPLDVILRACHTFTARCYVLPRIADDGAIVVDFAPIDAADSLRTLTGEFANALLDARLRALVSRETQTVRELLVAQAFCEADLLDRRDSEADESVDPRGIAR
jgi:His-Xaa-Ser system protein HxsD